MADSLTTFTIRDFGFMLDKTRFRDTCDAVQIIIASGRTLSESWTQKFQHIPNNHKKNAKNELSFLSTSL